jgi:sigma-B regulation protein RsbU (phosphoserine phosphatase)
MDLDAVLAAFAAATGVPAVVWTPAPDGHGVRALAGAIPGAAPPLAELPPSPDAAPRPVAGGAALARRLPGARVGWVAVGTAGDTGRAAAHLAFLHPLVAQALNATLEANLAARELIERFEEINLLYSIGETLGRTVGLERSARAIVDEIALTVGVRRAALFVHDPASDALVAAAGRGADDVAAVLVGAPRSIVARVFRDRRTEALPSVAADDAHAAVLAGAGVLCVPITWTAPDRTVALGVLALAGRESGQPFVAGDQKLVAAVATLIGTVIRNAQLVRASVDQERLAREMQLAHELQMKLLPAAQVLAPDAGVAARMVPAESVGGDFYHWFRLGQGRVGVLVGDVSSHGYQAALIMAQAMSAVAIHAQTTADPGETVAALLASLRDELAATEMSISLFYAVVDPRASTLRYACAGFPGAFLLRATGAERLPALDPPLGLADARPGTAAVGWHAGQDLLLCFSDGATDARDAAGVAFGEAAVLAAAREARALGPDGVVDGVLAAVARHQGGAAGHDDLTVLCLQA